jgi:hypothetical protein
MASEPTYRRQLKDPTGEGEKGSLQGLLSFSPSPVRSWGWLSFGFGLIVAAATIVVPQSAAIDQQTTSLSPAMVIDRSVTVRPGVYRLSAAELRLDIQRR